MPFPCLFGVESPLFSTTFIVSDLPRLKRRRRSQGAKIEVLNSPILVKKGGRRSFISKTRFLPYYTQPRKSEEKSF